MKGNLGYIGIVIGVIAVAIAMFQDDLRSPAPDSAPAPATIEKPEKEHKTLKEKALDTGKKKLSEKLFGKKEEAPEPIKEESLSKRDKVDFTYMGLGLIALSLGIFSWAKKDHYRIASAAVALGVIAIAWQYVLIAVVIAVVIFILANVEFG